MASFHLKAEMNVYRMIQFKLTHGAPSYREVCQMKTPTSNTLCRTPCRTFWKTTWNSKSFVTERRDSSSAEREGLDGGRDGGMKSNSFEDARPLSSMPGPGMLKSIPYIGVLLLFKPFTKYSLETFSDMACQMHDTYGDVFKLRLGKNYSVHTCCVEDIERVFDQEPKYPRRRLMDLSRVYRERNGLPQGLGSCNDEEWQTLRKPLNVVMKRPKSVLSYVPSLNKVAEDFTDRILETDRKFKGTVNEKAEEIQKLFFKYSSEGIAVVCFNQRMGFLSRDFEEHPEKKKLLESFRISVECTFRAIMGFERRYLKTEDDKFYQKYQSVMHYIRQQSIAFIKANIPSGGQQSQSKTTGEFEETLLKNLLSRKDLSIEQICAIIDSLLIGGTDSTARILSVLLYDMAKHQDIQEKVVQETKQVADSNGNITKSSFEQLQFSKACVKESMRLHYPVTSGVERILTHDMFISGYHVPEGTSVFMTGAKTSKDPKYFPNPTKFMPDRWIREQRNTSHHSVESSGVSSPHGCPVNSSVSDLRLTAFSFIPFGHGVRSCIGSRFAEMELLMGLVKVLQRVRIDIHPSYEELKVKYTPFITPVEPIPFIFTERE